MEKDIKFADAVEVKQADFSAEDYAGMLSVEDQFMTEEDEKSAQAALENPRGADAENDMSADATVEALNEVLGKAAESFNLPFNGIGGSKDTAAANKDAAAASANAAAGATAAAATAAIKLEAEDIRDPETCGEKKNCGPAACAGCALKCGASLMRSNDPFADKNPVHMQEPPEPETTFPMPQIVFALAAGLVGCFFADKLFKFLVTLF